MAKKPSREAISARMKAATDDVRENGRGSRTITEIAKQFQCNPDSLKVRLGREGLLGPVTPAITKAMEARKALAEMNEAQSLVDSNQLNDKALTIPSSNVDGIMGEGGGNPPQAQTARSARPDSGIPALETLRSDLRSRIESSFRAGPRVYKCESSSDAERLYKLYVSTFADLNGESSGSSRGLIQISILGDSSAPKPKVVHAIEAESTLISCSPSELEPVEAVTVDA